MCVHCTNTCTRYQPLWPANWSSASPTHWASISQNVNNEAVGQWKKRLHASTKTNDITLNVCYTKTCSFHSYHTVTLHNRFFSEAATVNRGKRVILHHFHRSYLKANKVSKSDGTRKVKYAYYFWKCADVVDWKLSKLFHPCRSYSLANFAHFFSVVGVLSCRESSASTVNSGVGFWYNVGSKQ